MICRPFQPDRIKQFASVNPQNDSGRQDVLYQHRRDLEAVRKNPNPKQKRDTPTEDTEQRAPPGESHVDCGAGLDQMTGKTAPEARSREQQGIPLLNYVHEDYHREFSNMLGDVAVAR